MSTAARSTVSTIFKFVLLFGLAVAGCQTDDPVGPVSAAADLPGQITVTVTPNDVGAQWFLLRPDEVVEVGTGTTTLENMPVGQYSIVWGPVGGWQSPTPNPSQRVLTSKGEIGFSATYTPIQTQTGSIAIDAEPDEIDAPWTLTGPNGFLFSARGDLVLIGREAGDYTLTWGAVTDYEPQGPVQGTLVAGGRLDLAGTYVYQAPASTGTILIDVNPDQLDAPWSVVGPGEILVEGNGDASITETPVGDYTITFGAVVGWSFPVPTIVNETLTDGATLTYTGNYSPPDEPSPGDPVIDSVSGRATDGGIISISGSLFGSHSMEIESSLGPNAWIEANAAGTSIAALQGAPGWDVGTSTWTSPKISDTRAHSGNNSCYTYVGPSAEQPGASKTWQGVMRYQHTSTFKKIYFTYWIYPDLIAGDYESGDIQWKMWRVNDDGGVDPNDAGEIYQTSRYTAGGVPSLFHTIFYGNVGCDDPWNLVYLQMKPQPYYSKPVPSDYRLHDHILDRRVSYADTGPTLRAWNRVEVFLEASDTDAYNGRYLLTINKDGETRKQVANLSGILTHQSFKSCLRDNGTQPWQYFLLQNYFDNSASGSTPERADFFVDDIYIQFGTQARIELGDDPVFENCRQLEVQEATSWSEDGREVTIELNHGAFAPGSQVYLFVVSQDGNVSRGKSITLE